MFEVFALHGKITPS